MTDPFSLTGMTALVTGGTRGIGRAISLRFARAGARVVANYARNDEAAQSLATEAAREGLAIETVRADLTLPKGIALVSERIATAPPEPLAMVHCAATGVHRPFEQLTTRHLDWTMALNARAFFELVQVLLPRLGSGSAVVAMSSAGAVRAVPAYTAIGASKAALESMARHLAVELAPRGIRVNVLSPGSVATDAWDAFPDKAQRLADALRRSPTGSLVSVDEVAHAAQYLCSPASRGVSGHTLVVDNGARLLE
jgi:enoyl-[acyl-carrier protein] reductase III